MNAYLALFAMSMLGLMLCDCGGDSSSEEAADRGGGDSSSEEAADRGGGDSSSEEAADCGAFSACGGELEGTWTVDGSCPEGDLDALMMKQSNAPAACKDMFRDVTMEFTGTLTFAAGTETIDGTSTTNVNALYTAACISAMAGRTITSLNQQACDGAEQGAVDNGGSATCSLVGSACECDITIVETLQGTESYTAAGGTITYSDGSSSSYCVSGSELTLRGEVEAGFYMQQTMHR